METVFIIQVGSDKGRKMPDTGSTLTVCGHENDITDLFNLVEFHTWVHSPFRAVGHFCPMGRNCLIGSAVALFAGGAGMGSGIFLGRSPMRRRFDPRTLPSLPPPLCIDHWIINPIIHRSLPLTEFASRWMAHK